MDSKARISVNSTTTAATGLVVSNERIIVLDILRGFAILGMIIVHFIECNPNTSTKGLINTAVQNVISAFITDKSRWTFSMLFGVGFAIQLRRADALGGEVCGRFLRRLVGVAAFGVLTGVLIGAMDLINYAWAGAWLLLFRRWSTRRLLLALILGISLIGAWNVAMGSYQWATMGIERANATYRSPYPLSPDKTLARKHLRSAEAGTSFARLSIARFIWIFRGPSGDLIGDWRQGNPGVLLNSLASALSIFLIGLLLLRKGVFDRPREHRLLLYIMMIVGTTLWAISHLHMHLPVPAAVNPVTRIATSLQSGFGLFYDGYFALTYVAGITLLVASSKAWEQRLRVMLGAAGRMALTNYVLQFAVLGLLFDNYALGIKWLEPKYAPLAGAALFTLLSLFSRWWISRFRFGPAEWVLRSLTYAKPQPLRQRKT